jgi:hypothetical protein
MNCNVTCPSSTGEPTFCFSSSECWGRGPISIHRVSLRCCDWDFCIVLFAITLLAWSRREKTTFTAHCFDRFPRFLVGGNHRIHSPRICLLSVGKVDLGFCDPRAILYRTCDLRTTEKTRTKRSSVITTIRSHNLQLSRRSLMQ